MAIEKRKYANRTTYRAFWRNPWTGKIEKGPARESRREAARDDAEIKVKIEFEPDFFMPEGYTPPGRVHTLYHLSEMYLARTDLAESTRKMDYFHFSRISPHLGQIPATDITRDNLKAFEEAQLKEGVKQNTIQRRISIVRAILNWAVEKSLITENPVQGYRCKRGEDLKLPPPSPSEIKMMLEYAPPHLQRAIILGYYLGVRVGPSELLSMKWEDFDEERRRMRVWSAKKNKSKPWRDIDLVDLLYETMLVWRKEDEENGIAHLISFHGKPIGSIKRAWHTMMDELKKKNKIVRRIRPYDLRHAFATEAIAEGADIKAVSDIMGHSDTSMIHRHYQHVVDEQKMKVVKSIPDILSGVQQRGTKQEFSGAFLYPDKINLQ